MSLIVKLLDIISFEPVLWRGPDYPAIFDF